MQSFTIGLLRKTVRQSRIKELPCTTVSELAQLIGADSRQLRQFMGLYKLFEELGITDPRAKRVEKRKGLAYWRNHGASAMSWLLERLDARGESVLEALNHIRKAQGKPTLPAFESPPTLVPAMDPQTAEHSDEEYA